MQNLIRQLSVGRVQRDAARGMGGFRTMTSLTVQLGSSLRTYTTQKQVCLRSSFTEGGLGYIAKYF